MGVKDCISIYETLLNKKYILYLENGILLEVTFSKSNLKHLLGLHKLKDMPFVERPANEIYKMISQNIVSDSVIEKSLYYSKIAERIIYFRLIPELLKSKIIVNFDASKIPDDYTSKLTNTKYILYRKIDGVKVAHLTLAEGTKAYFPETFFVEPSNIYLTDQTFYDIKKVEIIDFSKKKRKKLLSQIEAGVCFLQKIYC